jgi:DNA/RNA-binding domain of Phe-tRNA-synthetase-like protein
MLSTTISTHHNIAFDCSPEIQQLGVKVAVFTMSGLQNRKTSPEFDIYAANAIRDIQAELHKTPLQDDRILNGYRNLHTRVGFSNRTFPAASENLLEYILKRNHLPRINLLVDIYNLASAKTRLSMGAHDLRAVSGNVHFRLTTGEEEFHPLGTPASKKVRPGGYAYIDDANDVLCLLEVKQVEKTKVTVETTDAFFIVQGNSETHPTYVNDMAGYLIASLKKFCGGREQALHWA